MYEIDIFAGVKKIIYVEIAGVAFSEGYHMSLVMTTFVQVTGVCYGSQCVCVCLFVCLSSLVMVLSMSSCPTWACIYLQQPVPGVYDYEVCVCLGWLLARCAGSWA